MGVTCQILIIKAKEGVHRAGKPIKGVVKYVVDEKTEYKDVVLSLLGKGICEWSQRHGKSTSHYRGTEEYIVHHVNVCNKRPEETITLHGEYEHPFEFFLPEDIPRSYKDRRSSITYTIQLKFEKPSFFSFNKVFTTQVPVYSYVNPETVGPIIFGLEKTLFSLFAANPPVVNLKAEIAKTCFMPGENAHISWKVCNDTDVEITSVRADLYCYTTYTANSNHVKHESYKVKSCEVKSSAIAERSVRESSCILPTLPELYSLQNSKVIQMEYRVRLTVRLPLPHINATVELPILIGEQKGSIETGVEASEYEENNEPPSYFEVLCKEDNPNK